MVRQVAAFLNRKNSLAGASFILIITLFLSNVLGVVRDHFLTQKIPTELLSVYYAAFRIPDLIFNILILGAITSAFIPIFTTLISRKQEDEAWLVASSVINIAIVFLVCFSVLLGIFMPLITPLFVPGFDPVHQELTTKLARIMLLSPILFGLSYIVGGILNSYKRFVVYSLAPLVYNLAIILGAIVFGDKFGVVGIAVAVVIGAFMHFAIQLPVALKLGFRFSPKIIWQHWGVKRIGLLMIPRAIALGANQILLLIFTAIASSIGGYSIAIYNLADNIQTMPMVVFGTSFATAIFPTLAEAVSHKKFAVFTHQIEKIMRIILFFMIPLTAIMILLKTQIVRLILGSGHFGWEQTIFTGNTLGYFSLSLVFTGLAPLYARSFYALHNTKIPMIVTLGNVILSIVLGKIFVIKMGVEGLALGFSIGSAVGAVVLYLILRTKVKFLNERSTLLFIIKVLIASLLMAIAIQEAKILLGMFVNMHRFWGVAVQTLGSLGVGLLVYLTLAWIFGCEEIRAIKFIMAKFTKRPNQNGEDLAKQEFN